MIKLLKLLTTKKSTVALFVLMGIAAGLFNLGIISLINAMVEGTLDGTGKENALSIIFSFLLFIVGWFITRKILAVYLIRLTQRTLWEYRNQIIKGISKSDFIYVHKNKNRIHAIITEDVSDVAGATSSMVDFLISCVTILVVFVYLAYLSIYFFLATIVVVALGVLIYEFRGRKNVKLFKIAKSLLDRFHLDVNSSLDGFKESKIDERKSKAIQAKIQMTGEESIKNNSKALISFLDNEMVGQVAFYLLVAIIAMFLGNYLEMEPQKTVTYLFTLLFIQGPIELVMILLPSLTRAGVALDRITELEFPMSDDTNEDILIEPLTKENFQSLEANDLSFNYPTVKNVSTFNIEKVNMTISKGDIVFISGGNGSGKTTLINLLVALLDPTSGDVLVNGDKEIYANNKRQYRTLFSPVFSDFHLFEELYGVMSDSEVNEYLKFFEIDHKVSFENNKFSTKDLSTGQRKRLALISSIAEDKPIIVLDEWAADQDPVFRRKFYKEILPLLKSKGFTILAITHDDAYFNCADKHFHMSEGKCAVRKQLLENLS